MATFVVSPAKGLISQDWTRWAHNALVFAGPALLVLLASIVKEIPTTWAQGAIVLYALNVLTDILRKWLSTNTYSK